MKENMFIMPCRELADTQAIQAAVNEAHASDLRTVLIPKRDTPWMLEHPVKLPDYVTVILHGAVIHAKGTAFQNENAETPFALATEQKNITILGTPGACILSETGYQINFANVQKFRISGIRFENGQGISLLYARKGRWKTWYFTLWRSFRNTPGPPSKSSRKTEASWAWPGMIWACRRILSVPW